MQAARVEKQRRCAIRARLEQSGITAADIQGNLAATHDKDVCQPAMRVGQRQELGWAATFLASPYARFISGHTLVVDGANWQRRALTNPPVVPIREQMGRPPFGED